MSCLSLQAVLNSMVSMAMALIHKPQFCYGLLTQNDLFLCGPDLPSSVQYLLSLCVESVPFTDQNLHTTPLSC